MPILNQNVTLPDDAEAMEEFLTDGSALWKENAGYLDYLLPLLRTDDTPPETIIRIEKFLALWFALPFAARTWSTYGVARRVITFSQMLPALPRFSETLQKRFWEVFYEEACHLHAFLEWDVEGNHLVKNMLALVHAACVFAQEPTTAPDAARWWRTIDKHLLGVFDSQILPDGFHFEQTPMYHVWVLVDLLDTLVLLKQHRPQYNPVILETLAGKMLAALVNITHLNGNIPLFGDSSLWQTPPPMLVAQFAKEQLNLETPMPDGVHYFDDAGFLVVREVDPARSLVIKCGNFGPKDLPAHAHCDIGSLDVVIDGVPYIVDSGTGDYEASMVRDYFRGTGAHNTLWVEGKNQAEIWGSFRVAEHPSDVAREFEHDDIGTKISLQYRNYDDTYEHKRSLYAIRDTFWVVQDWLMHLHPKTLTPCSLLHIHPERSVKLIDNRIFEIGEKLIVVPFGMKSLGWSDHSPWHTNLNLYSEGFHKSRQGRLLWQEPKGADCFGWVMIPYPYAEQKPVCTPIGEGLKIELPHRHQTPAQTWMLTWEADGLKILQADQTPVS